MATYKILSATWKGEVGSKRKALAKAYKLSREGSKSKKSRVYITRYVEGTAVSVGDVSVYKGKMYGAYGKVVFFKAGTGRGEYILNADGTTGDKLTDYLKKHTKSYLKSARKTRKTKSAWDPPYF